MNKRACFLMIGFLVLCLGLGCDAGSEANQPVMHVSKRVKIERSEPVAAKAEIQTPGAGEKADSETSGAAAGQPGSAPIVVAKSEPAADSVPKPTDANGKPDSEAKAEETVAVKTLGAGEKADSESSGAAAGQPEAAPIVVAKSEPAVDPVPKTTDANGNPDSEVKPEAPVAAQSEESPVVKTLVAHNDSGDTTDGQPDSAPMMPGVSEPAIETVQKETDSPMDPADPADPAAPEQTEITDLFGEKQALFGDLEKYYVKKGRIDPFAPFLHKPEPEVTDASTPQVQRRAPRTPLERIALGQLKLTAVMRLTNDKLKMAMVEDNTGKGYIVEKGTYIGENGGRVSDIKEDKVMIEETYKDVFGKTSVRQIELKLQKQPGE